MINGRKVLALIPARGGSKGMPGKNIAQLAGKPLIAWTIEVAQKCPSIDSIVLSSDDSEIAEIAVKYECRVPFMRPAELATDEASSMDVVLHALENLPAFDVVLLLQPTSPLRTAADIEACLDLLQQAPAVVSLRPSEDHPFLIFQIEENNYLKPYAKPTSNQSLRRQDLPGAWCLNGAIYAADTSWLIREKSFFSPQTVGYKMPMERSLDIDTPADLQRADELLRLLNNYLIHKEKNENWTAP